MHEYVIEEPGRLLVDVPGLDDVSTLQGRTSPMSTLEARWVGCVQRGGCSGRSE